MNNSCPITPLSCLEPENIFAGVYQPNCTSFANPNNFQAERTIFNSLIDEKINNYGVDIDYYVHTYNTETDDNFYGENLDNQFFGPTTLRVQQDYSHKGLSLPIMGYDADDEVVFYIGIDTFTERLSSTNIHELNNQRIEPKADDVFVISTFGCDRPNGRTAKKFVVTEVLDEDPEELNILMGHYVWRVTAKRFDYSFEEGVPHVNEHQQVYDNNFTGVLSSSIDVNQLSSSPKSYDYDVDEDVETDILPQDIFDQEFYGNTQESSSEYGDYY